MAIVYIVRNKIINTVDFFFNFLVVVQEIISLGVGKCRLSIKNQV